LTNIVLEGRKTKEFDSGTWIGEQIWGTLFGHELIKICVGVQKEKKEISHLLMTASDSQGEK